MQPYDFYSPRVVVAQPACTGDDGLALWSIFIAFFLVLLVIILALSFTPGGWRACRRQCPGSVVEVTSRPIRTRAGSCSSCGGNANHVSESPSKLHCMQNGANLAAMFTSKQPRPPVALDTSMAFVRSPCHCSAQGNQKAQIKPVSNLEELPEGREIVLTVKSPVCGHCRSLADYLRKNENSLKKDMYMVELESNGDLPKHSKIKELAQNGVPCTALVTRKDSDIVVTGEKILGNNPKAIRALVM